MKTERLTPAESLLLDIIRVSAAIAVAVGHLTQSFFSTRLPDLISLARASVAVFFVLSGFVIRYVTLRRRETLSGYLKDRASRIYSVALPALFITCATAFLAHSVNPTFYAIWHHTVSPVVSILANLTFLAQIWTLDVSPLSNSPFWSLNYEVIYYLLYGFAFYLKGHRRWILITAVSLIAGPKILLLFPVWLVGCLAHDLYQSWNARGKARVYLNRAVIVLTALLSVFIVLAAASPHFLHGAAELRDMLKDKGAQLQLGNTGGAVTFCLFGILGTPFLLRLLLLVRDFVIDTESRKVRSIKFLAEGTFPIYLLHFPLYVVIAACVPYDHASLLQKGIILCIVIATGVLAGPPCNWLKMKLRALV